MSAQICKRQCKVSEEKPSLSNSRFLCINWHLMLIKEQEILDMLSMSIVFLSQLPDGSHHLYVNELSMACLCWQSLDCEGYVLIRTKALHRL